MADYQTIILVIKSKPSLAEIRKLIGMDGLPTSESDPDLLIVEKLASKQSIGIGELDDLKAWVGKKPFQGGMKLALIPNADSLTTQAQNSLLKVLEEPATDTLICLQVRNAGSLISTVRSRCKLIVAEKSSEIDLEQDKINELAKKYVSGTLPDKLQINDKLEEWDRAEICRFLEAAMTEIVAKKQDNPSQAVSEVLEFCNQALKGLQAGTNTKLTMLSVAITMDGEI